MQMHYQSETILQDKTSLFPSKKKSCSVVIKIAKFLCLTNKGTFSVLFVCVLCFVHFKSQYLWLNKLNRALYWLNGWWNPNFRQARRSRSGHQARPTFESGQIFSFLYRSKCQFAVKHTQFSPYTAVHFFFNSFGEIAKCSF